MSIPSLSDVGRHGFAIGLLLVAVLWFSSTGRDDVHISYWAAHALETHGTLLNYSGVPLEQSSSLLHVLLLVLTRAVTGLPLPDAGTALSILFGVLAVIEAGRLAARFDHASRFWAMVLAATATPLAYWAFGALEGPIVAFLMTAILRNADEYLGGSQSSGVLAAVWTGLLVLIRPEGWFVACAFPIGGSLMLRDRGAALKLLHLAAAATFVFGLAALWRWITFHQIFPQPVYAKVSGHLADSALAGAGHLVRVARQCPGMVVLFGASVAGLGYALRRPLLRRTAWLALVMVAVQMGFAVTSGGDWMEGARFFVPIVPALAVLASVALTRMPRGAQRWIGSAAILLGLLLELMFARYWSTGIPLFQKAAYEQWATGQGLEAGRFTLSETLNRVHLRDALFVPHLEEAIDRRLAEQGTLTVMSAQGGMVPFHFAQTRLGRVRFLDMSGLTSRDFSDCRVVKEHLPARAAGGIGLTYDFYLAHRTSLERECGIPRPDIVYDLDFPGFPVGRSLEAAGYALTYRQDFDVCPPGLRCAPSVKGRMFIAELPRSVASKAP